MAPRPDAISTTATANAVQRTIRCRFDSGRRVQTRRTFVFGWNIQLTNDWMIPSGQKHSQKRRPASGVSSRTTRNVTVAAGWMRHASDVGAPKNAAVTAANIATATSAFRIFLAFIVRPPRS